MNYKKTNEEYKIWIHISIYFNLKFGAIYKYQEYYYDESVTLNLHFVSRVVHH